MGVQVKSGKKRAHFEKPIKGHKKKNKEGEIMGNPQK